MSADDFPVAGFYSEPRTVLSQVSDAASRLITEKLGRDGARIAVLIMKACEDGEYIDTGASFNGFSGSADMLAWLLDEWISMASDSGLPVDVTGMVAASGLSVMESGPSSKAGMN
jgi:hypothetical protein